MFKKIKNYLIFGLIICFAVLFLSKNSFAKDYEIAELLTIAEQNSYNIKSLDSLVSAQQKFANQQKYWDNPVTTFDNNFGQQNYTISQSIPFYNKLQNKYNIDATEAKVLEVKKNNLALMVKAELFSLLYQYQILQKKIELAQTRINRLSLLEKYLANIVLNSPSKKSQAQITRDRIKLIQRDLAKNQNLSYQLWNRANVFLNLDKKPDKIILNWLDGKKYQGRQYYINQALESNLDLREQQLLIDKYKSELSYAKIEKMPDVNIAITHQNNNSAQSNYKQDSNSLGLSIAVPLINRNQEKILGAESKIKAQQYAFDFQKNQLLSQVNNDLNQYEVALKMSKNFPMTDINKIVSRLANANADFKKGILDFIIYIELDSQEYQIIDAILDTQIDIANSYSRLMIDLGNCILP